AGSSTANLLQALEDYLPVLLGLVKEGSELRHSVQFVWTNQEDKAEETAMADAWYEVLSVLHLMAMVCLLQANSLLLPRAYGDGYGPRVSEESRRATVDVFLKASGYLDCAIRQVLPQIPSELRFSTLKPPHEITSISFSTFLKCHFKTSKLETSTETALNFRRQLPVDLAEGNLKALSMQALGQGVDMQLGLAIDSPKATLAVKRRLACEMVKYWHQVQESIPELPVSEGWGKKHLLFVKWKYVEAKSAAYYFHGLILDEGNSEKSHGMAIAALEASEEFLKESKRASAAFHATPPTSRSPTPFGTAKYLFDKIPKEASSKVRINQDLYTPERVIGAPPPLPDFSLALTPEDYDLPPLDPLWNKEDGHQ
uniref:BRO1 domain-containing protein n=1 Tax=Aegilops tauschii subsp. strangulata TaxID=200361 RepID=A0A453CGM7_AEGTS